MCGITGYNGNNQAAPVLLAGLEKLEYRGYDSAGIAVRDGDKPVEIVKAKGRLRVLAEKTDEGKAVAGTCGIGHTRWATHGEPQDGQPMVNQVRTMLIRIAAMMAMWWQCIMELLKTTRN